MPGETLRARLAAAALTERARGEHTRVRDPTGGEGCATCPAAHVPPSGRVPAKLWAEPTGPGDPWDAHQRRGLVAPHRPAPPRPPRRQGHSEPQWVDPTPAGAPQDPGTHTSVGGWQRRPAHTVRTGAAAPAQGPAVVARVANGTRSQASRSFSLHPHLRQRFRPYQVTAAANFRTCAPGRQAAPSPGTARPAFCRPQPLLSLLQGDGALKARQFSRWNKAHTQSLHSCR